VLLPADGEGLVPSRVQCLEVQSPVRGRDSYQMRVYGGVLPDMRKRLRSSANSCKHLAPLWEGGRALERKVERVRDMLPTHRAGWERSLS